jgi:hypothetical protein
MISRDLLFTGMNITREARKILNGFTNVTTGMNDGELRAYEMGVKNALSVVKMLCEEDEHIVFHLEGHDRMEEFDLNELIEIVEEKEGY